ncbi:hypothetical protein HYH02_006084 [Chlamydomonas schloesseri]|uniref:Uncharacterized protein n=1 Tax=Chlamydomonas schloesseri TaxID=2026947 RepID=A0A835WK32_9CHLO|nr:hypothetical protein HYH02_006084 [Chlamydomonas schloesseri]|eukprot:KAG2448728.1 hypothetical protein HYH02_006084 [Chlamydomonas schloesseri]
MDTGPEALDPGASRAWGFVFAASPTTPEQPEVAPATPHTIDSNVMVVATPKGHDTGGDDGPSFSLGATPLSSARAVPGSVGSSRSGGPAHRRSGLAGGSPATHYRGGNTTTTRIKPQAHSAASPAAVVAPMATGASPPVGWPPLTAPAGDAATAPASLLGSFAQAAAGSATAAGPVWGSAPTDRQQPAGAVASFAAQPAFPPAQLQPREAQLLPPGGQEQQQQQQPQSDDGHCYLDDLVQLLLQPDDDDGGGQEQAWLQQAGAAGGAGYHSGRGTEGAIPGGGGGGGGGDVSPDNNGAKEPLNDLHALAAALEAAEAALGAQDFDLGPLLPAADFDEDADAGDGDSGGVWGSSPSGPGDEEEHPANRQQRRARLVAKRTAAAAAAVAAPGTGPTAGPAAAAATTSEGWHVMLAAPSPHNPENVATLLAAGLLVRPQTAKPAPLLALAMEEEQKRKQQQQQPGGSAANTTTATAAAAAPAGPAAAVLRCSDAVDVEAALGLHGRRVYCPPAVPGGTFAWRPLTVAVQRTPAGAAVPLADRRPPGPSGPRTREAGPTVRRVVMRGVPDHMGADDLAELFGSGLQLPGHCDTPLDRRFLLLCPDHVSFQALLGWHGCRLPVKCVDALQQIVPHRVEGWTQLSVEEDDGVLLPALVSQLLAAARQQAAAGDATAVTTLAAATRPPNHSQQQRFRPPGRFHPADLDLMDEADAEDRALEEAEEAAALLAAEAAARQTAAAAAAAAAVAAPKARVGAQVPGVPDTQGKLLAAAGSSGSSRSSSLSAPEGVGGAAGSAAAAAAAFSSSQAGGGRAAALASVSRPRGKGASQSGSHGAGGESDEVAAAAAAAAERAESSRGASSSGLSARPAPRPRRAGAASHFASSAAGGFWGAAPGPGSAASASALNPCACCPLPGTSQLPAPPGGAAAAPNSWSGAAAVELLNKLLALGIDAGLDDDLGAALGGGGGSSDGGVAGGGTRAHRSGGSGAAAVAGGGAEDGPDEAPYFRRSRKRMSTHFDRRPEDYSDHEEEEEEEEGLEADSQGGEEAGQQEEGLAQQDATAAAVVGTTGDEGVGLGGAAGPAPAALGSGGGGNSSHALSALNAADDLHALL